MPYSVVNNNGVSISTVPSFESAGQPAPVAEPSVAAAYCAWVHAAQSDARGGIDRHFFGNVTTVFFKSDCPSMPSG